MSLLSGIKYIPRSNRANEDSERNELKKDKKKEKKRSHDSKKHKYSDSDSDVDMNVLAKQHEDLFKSDNSARMSWMHDSRSMEETDYGIKKQKKDSSLKPNEDKFRGLMNSIQSYKPTESDVEYTSSTSLKSENKTIIAEPVNENQSIAALLRSKLKTTKGSISSEVVKSTAPKVMIGHLAKPVNLDDNTLRGLVAAEKSGGHDMDDNWRKNIMRLGDKYDGKFLSTGHKTGADEDDEIDMKMFESVEPSESQRKREIMNSIKEDSWLQQAIKRCKFCVGSRNYSDYSKYTIVLGQYTYLRLKPAGVRLHDFHCEILPLQHIASVRKCEEEVILELNRFKSCLRRLADQAKCSMIFVESATHFSKMPHCSIDCIPVEDERDMVACYKEAFASIADEWSQHRKAIELKRDRPLHRALLMDFEYVSVEWGDEDTGTYSGIVQVVENSGIDQYFCLDIAGGALGEIPMRMRTKLPVDADYEDITIKRFKISWESFDWTKYM